MKQLLLLAMVFSFVACTDKKSESKEVEVEVVEEAVIETATDSLTIETATESETVEVVEETVEE